MKKLILAISLLAVISSCKKKDDNSNDFTATDVTGTSVLKGNVNKNVITPNGSGGWINTSRIAAANVNISVKVNKNSLYPGSSASGADVYAATTNANGDFSVTVRSNATGVAAQVVIDGFTGTMDTIANGTTRTGLYSSYPGTTVNRTLFMGQNSQLDYQFTGVVVSTNPNTNLKIGTATISGSLAINHLREIQTGTLVTLTTTNVALANQKVYMNFSNDPATLTTKLYETTTDAAGRYSFNVTTVAAIATGFPQNATIWIADFAATRDTMKVNSTTLKTGRSGVYQSQTIFQNGVVNTNIRNANNLLYSSFVQD